MPEKINSRSTEIVDRIRKPLALVALGGVMLAGVIAPVESRADNPPQVPGSEWTFGAYDDAPLAQIDDPVKSKIYTQQRVDQIHDLIGDGGDLKLTVRALPGDGGQRTMSDVEYQALRDTLDAAKVDNLHTTLIFIPNTARHKVKINGKWVYRRYNFPQTPNAVKAFVNFEANLAYKLKANFEDGAPKPIIVDSYDIGNEPNNPIFLYPQYKEEGSKWIDNAAIVYEDFVWKSSKALLKASPTSQIVAGELVPHGNDNPDSQRPSVSPIQFIEDWAAAYKHQRLLGNRKGGPEFNEIAVHPYKSENYMSPLLPSETPTTVGPNDKQKIVDALSAFDFPHSIQPGAETSITFDEFGVQTLGPKAVSEETQAEYYSDFIDLTYCENVSGDFFKVTDNGDWSSGVNKQNFVHKDSYEPVKVEIAKAHAGQINCPQVMAQARSYRVQNRK